MESGVGDELPSWDPSQILFFSRNIYCSAEKYHIVTYISFPFCQIYMVCVVPVSSSYDKVSNLFFFYKIKLVIIYSPKKEKHRSLSKEKQNTLNNIAGCMHGKRSPLVCAVAGGNTAVPASHPDCLPPALQSQGRKFNPLFTSAP